MINTIKCVDILLPNVADLTKWAVVSCDQFTSEREYWDTLDKFVGDSPSTLRMIFPEVYLGDNDADKRIENINATMSQYIGDGIFNTIKDSFILVKRDTAEGNSRLGLIVAIDLEDYSYTHPTSAPLRATEGVVIDRIPPRLKIRKNAPIESPHIMLLMDDNQKIVIESLWNNISKYDKLYDFDLNMNGGHLTGYRVDKDEVFALLNQYEQNMKAKYGEDCSFMFAVGDGNHSLATAQAHWNEIKDTLSDDEKATHPARFALCELENLHDDGIKFEPIHRVVYNTDNIKFVCHLADKLAGDGDIHLVTDGIEYTLHCSKKSAECIADVQALIDDYKSVYKDTNVDYIHGIKHLQKVTEDNNGVAIIMPSIKKDELFPYVLEHGNLCRKAFSMGEAEEKRYYFECHAIK